ncbi:MAG: hypothetical protein L3J19_02445 [Sulfurimonas sp.]|nr:hypothetical protein [Sulfurimonas sp.]
MKLVNILLLLFVALSGNAKDLPSSIKIIQPLDKTRYVGENSTFVVNVTFEQADKIVITQENNVTTTVEVNSTKNTYCKSIKLHPGQNSVSVSLYKDSKVIKKEKRDLFFLSELFEGADEDAAEDYSVRYFHKDEKEQKCKPCHTMKSNVPTDGEAFEDVTKTTCYGCHKSMINTRNTHAPTANWLCLECHNGKVGEYNADEKGTSKYLAPDPISKTCGTCHDTVEAWQASKYGHGPVNDGRCVRCHNPHGSDNEFFLRKSIWYLCTTCHSEKASGQHVIPQIGFGRRTPGGGHPTRDRKDPARPGRDLVCSSCHNPHGSTGIYLLRMKGSFTYGVCQRCHKK